jgi:hypothetical protein
MEHCYLCKTPLSEDNISVEHIIPNSIGGRLKSTSLLCRQCNSKTGELYDGVFARIGNILANKYNIKREKGSVPNFIATEVKSQKEIIVKPGSVIYYLEPEITHGDGYSIIHAYSKERILQEVNRLNKEIGEGKIRVEDLTFEKVYNYAPKDYVYETIVEPDLFFRAISKIMINFYIAKTKDAETVEKVIEFIRTDTLNNFSWFYDLNISEHSHNSNPYHILIVKGSQKQKALYGYFELFGRKGFVTLLNGRYTGPEIQLEYTFDPINLKEINYQYTFSLNIADLIQLIHSKPNLDIIHDF